MNPFVTRLLLIVTLALAVAFRAPSLATYGFSDDEAAKMRAIAAYRRGDFSANAEHPMLMKLAMWGSVSAADRWNARVPATLQVAPETALRVPNVVAGSVTVLAVYGVAGVLFNPAVGVVAAALVALDPNITALNRIAKEDTFLMLFFLLAVFCYEHAKRVGVVDLPRAKRWYLLSAAGFGLMLASKYMPHFFGLYALYNVSYQWDAGDNAPDKRPFYAVMLAAFIAGNLAVLLPSTWTYCLSYLRGTGLRHHGEMYANRLYVTDIPVSFAGIPVTYYLDLIATKVPLVVLGAAAAALVPLVRRRRERGFVWLRVFLVFTLLGYSVMAAKFQRYGLPMLIFIDILAAVGIATGISWLWSQAWPRSVRIALSATACILIFGTLAINLSAAAPFYSMHQNAIGASLAPPATRFPEEAYDFGVREAVAAVASSARPGAVIVSDAPGIVEYYLSRSGRSDMKIRSLSMQGLARGCEQWVLIQDDHIYFENASYVEQLRRERRPWREYRVKNTSVLQVFRVVT